MLDTKRQKTKWKTYSAAKILNDVCLETKNKDNYNLSNQYFHFGKRSHQLNFYFVKYNTKR